MACGFKDEEFHKLFSTRLKLRIIIFLTPSIAAENKMRLSMGGRGKAKIRVNGKASGGLASSLTSSSSGIWSFAHNCPLPHETIDFSDG